VKQLLVLAICLTGCAARPATTIRGADLYAHVTELRDAGKTIVASSRDPITVRRDQYLVDRSRDQVFVVDQIIAGCRGGSLERDAECALALLVDQRFAVVDAPPIPRQRPAEGEDMSTLNKARLVTAVIGVGLAVGAAKCDAFDGCGTALGIAAGLDGFLLLALLAGGHD
jgi:hypothetical protein